jgi:hypothetical protein
MIDSVQDKAPVLLIPKEAEVCQAAAPNSIVFRMKDLHNGKRFDLLLTEEQVKQIADATNKLLH